VGKITYIVEFAFLVFGIETKSVQASVVKERYWFV